MTKSCCTLGQRRFVYTGCILILNVVMKNKDNCTDLDFRGKSKILSIHYCNMAQIVQCVWGMVLPWITETGPTALFRWSTLLVVFTALCD